MISNKLFWTSSLISFIMLKQQQEFFERKRQEKSTTRAAVPKRMDRMKRRGSQDLFSLEVIMSAHRNEKKGGSKSDCITLLTS